MASLTSFSGPVLCRLGWMKGCVALLIALQCWQLSCLHGSKQTKTVVGKEFVVVDGDGKVAAKLGMVHGAPRLQLIDPEAGGVRLELRLEKSEKAIWGSTIAMYGPDGGHALVELFHRDATHHGDRQGLDFRRQAQAREEGENRYIYLGSSEAFASLGAGVLRIFSPTGSPAVEINGNAGEGAPDLVLTSSDGMLALSPSPESTLRPMLGPVQYRGAGIRYLLSASFGGNVRREDLTEWVGVVFGVDK